MSNKGYRIKGFHTTPDGFTEEQFTNLSERDRKTLNITGMNREEANAFLAKPVPKKKAAKKGK